MPIKSLKEKGFVFISVKEFSEKNGNSKEIYTDDYFFIICVLKGTFCYTIEGRECEILGNHALYVGINKVFSIADIEDDENIIIAFSSDFYQRSIFDAQLLYSELFFSSHYYVALVPIPIENMKRDVSKKLTFHRENNTGLEAAVIHNIIEMLITDGLTHLQKYPLKDIEDPIGMGVVYRFTVLLQKHYKKEKQVNFYAKQLHISAKQLSRITQKNINKTAKEIIIDKIIQESMNMLSNSGHTITEICYDLGFENESNFSLFFKKHSGYSPSEFRQKKKTAHKNGEINAPENHFLFISEKLPVHLQS